MDRLLAAMAAGLVIGACGSDGGERVGSGEPGGEAGSVAPVAPDCGSEPCELCEAEARGRFFSYFSQLSPSGEDVDVKCVVDDGTGMAHVGTATYEIAIDDRQCYAGGYTFLPWDGRIEAFPNTGGGLVRLSCAGDRP